MTNSTSVTPPNSNIDAYVFYAPIISVFAANILLFFIA